MIVPLSTIVNWVREFQSLDRNERRFHLGNAEQKKCSRSNEMDGKTPKFDVLVTTYEMIGMEYEYFASTFDFSSHDHRRSSPSEELQISKIRSLTWR